MPDKKTLDKAKKATEEEDEDFIPEMEGPPEMEEEPGMDMAAEEPMMEEEPLMGGGSPVDALQSALDAGVATGDELMSSLMDAGFEVVPVGGAEAEMEADMGADIPAPPMGAPETAGGLRAQVRGAAARALGAAR
ncbi:MAG TPA: hypothetical protein EYN66_07350 [Myxococcales bacterium]|nr:hypothetical protein [Myxococcales bacterium]